MGVLHTFVCARSVVVVAVVVAYVQGSTPLPCTFFIGDSFDCGRDRNATLRMENMGKVEICYVCVSAWVWVFSYCTTIATQHEEQQRLLLVAAFDLDMDFNFAIRLSAD